MNYLEPLQKHEIKIKGKPVEVTILTVRRHDYNLEAVMDEGKVKIISDAKSYSEWECDVRLPDGSILQDVPGSEFPAANQAMVTGPEVRQWSK